MSDTQNTSDLAERLKGLSEDQFKKAKEQFDAETERRDVEVNADKIWDMGANDKERYIRAVSKRYAKKD